MDNDGYRDIFVSNGMQKRIFGNNDFLIYLEKKISGRSTERMDVDFEKHIDILLENYRERAKAKFNFLFE